MQTFFSMKRPHVWIRAITLVLPAGLLLTFVWSVTFGLELGLIGGTLFILGSGLVFVPAGIRRLRLLWPGLRAETRHFIGFIRWRIGTLLCLAFALSLVVLWIRSVWVLDTLEVPLSHTTRLSACSALGVITVGHYVDSEQEWTRVWSSHDVSPYLTRYMRKKWPFGWESSGVIGIRGRKLSHTSVRFPHWPPIVLLLTPLAFALWGAGRRYRRSKSGCCIHCGYDLRGSSERCPECGSYRPTSDQGKDVPVS